MRFRHELHVTVVTWLTCDENDASRVSAKVAQELMKKIHQLGLQDVDVTDVTQSLVLPKPYTMDLVATDHKCALPGPMLSQPEQLAALYRRSFGHPGPHMPWTSTEQDLALSILKSMNNIEERLAHVTQMHPRVQFDPQEVGLLPAEFYIDSEVDGESVLKTYEGLYTGRHLNGWALPLFTRETCEAILREYSGFEEEGVGWYEFQDASEYMDMGLYYFDLEDCPETPRPCKSYIVNLNGTPTEVWELGGDTMLCWQRYVGERHVCPNGRLVHRFDGRADTTHPE